MRYSIFKKMYHDYKGSAGHANEDVKNNSVETKGMFFATQKAFDNIFETLVNKDNIDSHNIPFWLMELYNDFVRVVENEKFNSNIKLSKTLEIFKQLYMLSFFHLGSINTLKSFKN